MVCEKKVEIYKKGIFFLEVKLAACHANFALDNVYRAETYIKQKCLVICVSCSPVV